MRHVRKEAKKRVIEKDDEEGKVKTLNVSVCTEWEGFKKECE